MQLLDEIVVSDDKSTTHVGAGNRWIDVYEYLTPKNLSAVGGRVAEIGVGGLTLGGGISFFSGRYGWAVDSVRNYGLVTASGQILQVNHESHPDLYWALRGGGNNFGIVTRFDLETFPSEGMWGGTYVTDMSTNATIIDAFVDFAYAAPQDVDASVYTAFAYSQENDAYFASSELVYAKPVSHPAILKNFTKVPSIQSMLRISNMSDLALELNASNPNGLRESYWTATFQMSRKTVPICLDVFSEEMEAIKAVKGIVPALVLQPITTDVIAKFARNGGNCLGIHESEGPLLLMNFAVMWENAADDEAVLGVAKRIIDRSMEKAREIGMGQRYIYQNYADVSQDVFAGYGEENLRRLKRISKAVDPDQVFQRLQPGYFKL